MRYREYAPTGFDSKGAFLPDRQEWLVLPVSINRDSGPLSESNFESAKKTLDDAKAEYEVHRFGHWGPGWFEIILVNPAFESVVEDIERSLEDYPCLDENDLSEREYDEFRESWDNWGRSEFTHDIKSNFELSEEEDDMLDFHVDIDSLWRECTDHIGWEYQMDGDSVSINLSDASKYLSEHPDLVWDAIKASYSSKSYLDELKRKEDARLANWLACTKA
jgi:hypothetical protein